MLLEPCSHVTVSMCITCMHMHMQLFVRANVCSLYKCLDKRLVSITHSAAHGLNVNTRITQHTNEENSKCTLNMDCTRVYRNTRKRARVTERAWNTKLEKRFLCCHHPTISAFHGWGVNRASRVVLLQLLGRLRGHPLPLPQASQRLLNQDPPGFLSCFSTPQ